MRTTTHYQGRIGVARLGLALAGLYCVGLASCRTSHEPTCCTEPELPSRTAAAAHLDPGWPRANREFVQVCYEAVRADVPKVEGAELVNDDEICMTCHGTYVKAFHENVHRNNGCESCHGPGSKHVEARGKEPGLIFSFKTGPKVNGAVLAEACLRCHEQDACSQGAQWRTSKHAHCGVTCVNCHRAHYNVPFGTPATTEPQAAAGPKGGPYMTLTAFQLDDKAPATNGKAALPSLKGSSNHLGAVAPGVCFRCHGDKVDLMRVAGPHQIGGANGFNCTSCHDSHGNGIKESSRKDLCLGCHKGTPTMAWHSSIHELNGVSCTDCHNPHPSARVRDFVEINHYGVERPKRMAMAVQEPEACYKCHQKMFGLNHLPSHHPIMEGKMVCSDCHDPHGQMQKNLKAETINQLCYKCHGDKTGPFTYPHTPVNENCCICHEPHGTVANNLLRQPPNFLCLRCHVGHRRVPPGQGHPNPVVPADIDHEPNERQPLYTNCTQCHAQVHGTDVPTFGPVRNVIMR